MIVKETFRNSLEEVAHVVGVGVEVCVRGPGVCLHAAQARGDLRLLIAGVSLLTSLGQQTVGKLESQPVNIDDNILSHFSMYVFTWRENPL